MLQARGPENLFSVSMACSDRERLYVIKGTTELLSKCKSLCIVSLTVVGSCQQGCAENQVFRDSYKRFKRITKVFLSITSMSQQRK